MDDVARLVQEMLLDPKVAKAIDWWRRRNAWGLPAIDQDAVVSRAMYRTALKHRPVQELSSSFRRFLKWESDRELRRLMVRNARHRSLTESDEDEFFVPVEPERDSRFELVWRWADRYLSADDADALRAVYRDGLSMEKYAAAVGRSADSVSASVHSAIARLKVVAAAAGWDIPSLEDESCD